jgi:hypothetical protein
MLQDTLNLILTGGIYIDLLIIIIVLSACIIPLAYWQALNSQKAIKSAVEDGFYNPTSQPANSDHAQYEFDSSHYLEDPDNIDMVSEWFQNEINKQGLSGSVERLIFIQKKEESVETLTLKALLSSKVHTPSSLIQLWRPESASPVKHRAERIVLVNDLIYTGTAIKEAIDKVKNAGGKIEAVFVLYDQEREVKINNHFEIPSQKLSQEKGIKLSAMFTASQILEAIHKDRKLRDIAKEKGIITDNAD